jgi:DNA-binding CsgD family transcriptional regulator
MADARDIAWRFINLAPALASKAALDELFAETLQAFGVERFDCVRFDSDTHTRPATVLSDSGLAAWRRHFLEQGYEKIDPSPRALTYFNGAFTWADVKALMADEADTAMWSDARDGGMGDGLIIPAAPRKITSPIVRLITADSQFDADILPLMKSISVIYASSIMSFTDQPPVDRALADPDTQLTTREIECLHWCARGKTNVEIATILAISRHTVNSHIENAKRKLGVATRVQAAAIAHQLGLLSIA